ncbi:MAG: hypothetical protein G3M70_01420 [Candidatus Nitronauta litoralis]|uniref:Antitoxin FitA-like ribbon-helix-helix domain-containing protein n=1 Tax=Candidatus Nitronauta litoralis TaxID=2705533 RepID=A0A7T0FZ00_9BACT|nr:MAG: hypothetical protein G3M70_01420 [Candidatus Nitronauta litoralis]
MANITIRDLPENTRKRLQAQAAQAGVSLEAYVRQVLQKASSSECAESLNILGLAEQYFGAKHGVELELPKRNSKSSS